jgi:acyl-CoA thioesterase
VHNKVAQVLGMSQTTMPDPQTVGAAMYAADGASQGLGIKLEAIERGYAKMSMRVRADMLNGHNICHGGFVFTLADSTFAFACNSYNHITVAAGASIEFLAPAYQDEVLTAEAREQNLSGRTGFYDVTVTNQRGERIALFRGRSQRLKDAFIVPAL